MSQQELSNIKLECLRISLGIPGPNNVEETAKRLYLWVIEGFIGLKKHND